MLELLTWQPLHLRRFYHRCIDVCKAVNGDVDFNFGLRRKIGENKRRYSSLKDWNSLTCKSDIKQSIEF